MKQLIAFVLTLALIFSQGSVCFGRTVSTYDVLLNMDPAIVERFRSGGVEDEMIREFMDVLDTEADKLQKPEDRETLESYFLSLLLLYVFQQEHFLPVVVAFDQQFPEEVSFIAETGALPQSLDLFFLSVMGGNLAYTPPPIGGPVEGFLPEPSVAPTPEPTPEPTPPLPFSDLEEHPWAHSAVRDLFEQDLIHGYPDGTFGPDKPISRAELTALVSEAFLDQTYYYNLSAYPDVNLEDWFYRDLLTAEYFSLFQWIYEGDFSPDSSVTRQELCAIVYRAYRRSENELKKTVARFDFLDFSQIAGYAYDPIQQLQQAGCVSGYEDGCFYPQKLATRAETAKLLAAVIHLK